MVPTTRSLTAPPPHSHSKDSGAYLAGNDVAWRNWPLPMDVSGLLLWLRYRGSPCFPASPASLDGPWSLVWPRLLYCPAGREGRFCPCSRDWSSIVPRPGSPGILIAPEGPEGSAGLCSTVWPPWLHDPASPWDVVDCSGQVDFAHLVIPEGISGLVILSKHGNVHCRS